MTLPSRERFYGLGEALLRPAAPRRREAREAAGRTRSAREAWERLSARGLIPDRWVDDEAMRHAAEPFRQDEDGYGGWRSPPLSPFPPSVEAAVTLASDAAGVAAAEQFGKEWYWRMRRTFKSRPYAGSLWRVLPMASPLWVRHVTSLGPSLVVSATGSALRASGANPMLAWSYPGDHAVPPEVAVAMGAVRDAVQAAADGYNDARHGGRKAWSDVSETAWWRYQFEPDSGGTAGFPATVIGVTANVIAGAVMFDRASALGGRVLGSDGGPSDPFFVRAIADGNVSVGEWLDTMQNPYAPLLDILERGYFPGGFHSDSSGTRVVLMAAALDDRNMPRSSYGKR